ncbi:hypothetical protein K443DRAFT_641099 [Laccaria amethystina LaAM-08-1]|uniref:Uncharacterized protein n=1 Tax=Laccaria amethystina LaAM-08-1 TaxID=1095629 RepID=A0A0C9WZU8_9AGAR|nr:hypothetical protein K443DRAFT_641099 [Laccaria amethystina LaAM-08-1]
MANLAVAYDHLGKYVGAEKLKVQVLESTIQIPGPEHPDAMANDIATTILQGTVEDKLQVKVLDAGKEVVVTEHPHMTGAMTNLGTNGKLVVLAAKTALQHLQCCEAEIKAALSLSGISQMDYILLAGFNESVIHSGIGYLEEIHVILKSEFPSNGDLLSSLGRIFSPFPGMIFTTSPPYSFQTPVINSEGEASEWDEVVFTQAHTYTTLQMGHTMKEMELTSASIYPNEGKVPSGSGSGGGGGDANERKSKENIPLRKRLGSNSQKGSGTDSEGDDNDDEGDDDDEGGDSDESDSKGSSDANLPEISFDIQTEIYPNDEALDESESSQSEPSKFYQVLQLEGSITVQTKPPQLKPWQLASSHVEFKQFRLQSIKYPYYHLACFKVEINTREILTKFQDIKPAFTRAGDSESKVVEGNKQTLAGNIGSTFGMNGLKPTVIASISGTKGKESSSTKEVKVYDSGIIRKTYKGTISWNFTVDDSNQQQHGLDLHDLGSLPCASCIFVGSSDDAPPPPAPDLYGVEVMSCWSLIPSKSTSVKFQLVKPPTPYSNVCQIMKLDLPSQLSKPSHYIAVGKAEYIQGIKKVPDVIRQSQHKFTSYPEFLKSEEGAM